MAARRALSGERVLFLLALASTLLLASLLMLRGEAGGGGGPRAFRDGFTVAEGVARRAESAAGSATDAPAGHSNAVANANSNNLRVAIGEDGEGARTTTIKTQDGDEITIKHGGKKQVTTISRDEGGRITIQNVADAAEDAALEDAALEDAALADAVLEEAALEEGDTTAKPAVAVEGGGEAAAAATAGAVVVSGGGKVTVIQVGRDLTKVELSGAAEDEQEEAPAAGEDAGATR